MHIQANHLVWLRDAARVANPLEENEKCLVLFR
jgi:hypothetical protein